MVPGHVLNLDDYSVWVERLLDSCGGYLDEVYFSVELVLEDEFDTGSRPLALFIDRHRLRFHDGSYLSFLMSVGADLQPIGYGFHYARHDDELVWRYDKHPGHEAEFGTDTHRHIGPQDRREAWGEVDIADVLEWIAEDQALRTA